MWLLAIGQTTEFGILHLKNHFYTSKEELASVLWARQYINGRNLSWSLSVQSLAQKNCSMQVSVQAANVYES